MSGKRNVSVCRGHELANALYILLMIMGWKPRQSKSKNIPIRAYDSPWVRLRLLFNTFPGPMSLLGRNLKVSKTVIHHIVTKVPSITSGPAKLNQANSISEKRVFCDYWHNDNPLFQNDAPFVAWYFKIATGSTSKPKHSVIYQLMRIQNKRCALIIV